ncbi:hypothetical protein SY83_21000 [Paenibacillus swuensis]|uniref:Cytochrome P450 n=1 Tax=Paenibacillus swuensis TaxID=1178515 RepID=A0A172TN01_9BACL|nr:cytochrome P450 [Paenibacillus swuensis]ANE48346.1 hypothetical protein SY83_21000 [Paenibacillus swuensis]
MSNAIRANQSPKGHWLLGHVKQLFGQPDLFMEELRGYEDIVKIRLLREPNYVITNPDMIKEVLVTKQKSFKKPKVFDKLKTFVGEGILTSDHELHKRQRGMMQPSFSRTHIQKYAEDMVDIPSHYLDDWKDGETRSIEHDMLNIALAVITKTMFSMDVFANYDKIGKPMDTCLHQVTKRMRAIIDLPLSVPTKDNKIYGEALRILDEFIYDVIRERTADAEASKEDLLSVLMAARDAEDQTGMSDKQLRDEILTIFLAGHETTANTLTWAFYEITRHPEVLQRLQEELASVLDGREPTLQDYDKLGYTQNIIWEVLRLYPPAWLIGRKATEDVEIGEYLIQQGEEVTVSPYLMHRHPKYFPEPNRFRPERFDHDMVKGIPQFAYFPFGGGARVCIGNHFAMLEATLILATIAQRYEFRYLEEDQQVKPEFIITLRPKGGLNMTVHSRSAASVDVPKSTDVPSVLS